MYSDNLSGVNKVEVKGYPDGSYISDGSAVTVDTSKLGTDDIYSVSVTVHDNVGNKLTKSFEIRILVYPLNSKVSKEPSITNLVLTPSNKVMRLGNFVRFCGYYRKRQKIII